MIKAISTTSIGGRLSGRLTAAVEAGFNGIEFFHSDCVASGYSFRQIGNIVRDLGITSVALQPFRGFEGERGESLQQGLAHFRQFLDSASDLGATVVVMCANENVTACGPDEAADVLARLAEIARLQQLSLAYEALSWSYRIRDVECAWDAVRKADAPNLGLVVDSFHFGVRANTPTLLESIPSHKITALQLSTCELPVGNNFKHVSRNHRVLPSLSDPTVNTVVRSLLKSGYNGVFTLECFSVDLVRDDPVKVAHAGFERLTSLISCHRTDGEYSTS